MRELLDDPEQDGSARY